MKSFNDFNISQAVSFYLFTIEKPEIQNHFWTQRKNKILKIWTVFINKNSKYIFCT